jgi:GDSL-like Lipase/Acylhydrolase family
MATARRRSVGARLLLGVLVALSALGVAEGTARVLTRRIALATIPAETVRAHVQGGGMRPDPLLFWARAHVPNPAEGIGAHGFRYGPLTLEKPEGTWRAFALGDSQTYGAGVTAAESWPAVAEAWLSDHTGRAAGQGVQLINAGNSGYGSLQALRLITAKLLPFEPDLLIVDCRVFDQPREGLTGPPNPTASAISRLLFRSQLYYLLRRAIGAARRDDTTAGSWGGANPSESVAFGNHDLIADAARRAGIALVFIDYPVQGGAPGPGAANSAAPAAQLPPGSRVVAATAALEGSGLSGGDLFFDMNHLTPTGNQVVGRALSTALVAWGLAPPAAGAATP